MKHLCIGYVMNLFYDVYEVLSGDEIKIESFGNEGMGINGMRFAPSKVKSIACGMWLFLCSRLPVMN